MFENDTIHELEQEIYRWEKRIETLEKAIRFTLDYIDLDHAGECDQYGICINCSIRFELSAAMETK